MTEDERLILSTTITLHGFELFNRWLPSQGIWRPLLVGKRDGPQAVWCLREMAGFGGQALIDGPVRMNFDPDWVKLTWVELTDTQLSEFHRVVLLTC